MKMDVEIVSMEAYESPLSVFSISRRQQERESEMERVRERWRMREAERGDEKERGKKESER